MSDNVRWFLHGVAVVAMAALSVSEFSVSKVTASYVSSHVRASEVASVCSCTMVFHCGDRMLFPVSKVGASYVLSHCVGSDNVRWFLHCVAVVAMGALSVSEFAVSKVAASFVSSHVRASEFASVCSCTMVFCHDRMALGCCLPMRFAVFLHVSEVALSSQACGAGV